MKKARMIGVIMTVIAIVFVIFAVNHPEMNFPWSNQVTWTLYGLYVLVTIIFLFLPARK